MAAPQLSSRVIPTGWKMPDGYQTTISWFSDPGLGVWEQAVKPPGEDGGDPIDTTTMLNTKWRTKYARALKTLTDSTVVAAYDPDTYQDFFLLINHVDSITVHFPDHSTLVFWGYLQKFEIAEHKEGEMPLATLTIVPTNWDPVNYVEAGPVFTPAAGT